MGSALGRRDRAGWGSGLVSLIQCLHLKWARHLESTLQKQELPPAQLCPFPSPWKQVRDDFRPSQRRVHPAGPGVTEGDSLLTLHAGSDRCLHPTSHPDSAAASSPPSLLRSGDHWSQQSSPAEPGRLASSRESRTPALRSAAPPPLSFGLTLFEARSGHLIISEPACS